MAKHLKKLANIKMYMNFAFTKGKCSKFAKLFCGNK